MGYQESLIRTTDEDIQYLIDKIKELGKQWFDDKDVEPKTIVTLKKGMIIECIFDLWGLPYTVKTRFDKGTKFICFAGERQYQRSINLLLGDNLKRDIQLIFMENLPGEEMFKPNSELCYEETWNW